MQLCDQLVERGGDAAPVIEPFPRKPQRDLGGAERAFVDAECRAKSEPAECSARRIARAALRGRSGLRSHRAYRHGRGRPPARPDRPSPASRCNADRWSQPLGRSEHGAKVGDGDEQAVVGAGQRGLRIAVAHDRRLGGRRCERGPQEDKIDPLMGAGLTLHGHANRRLRHVEEYARDIQPERPAHRPGLPRSARSATAHRRRRFRRRQAAERDLASGSSTKLRDLRRTLLRETECAVMP